MGSFDAEILAKQLAQLGRDLDEEVLLLGELEEAAADAEGAFRKLESAYDDCIDTAFMNAPGNVDMRKAQARLACTTERTLKQQAAIEWSKAKGRMFTQQASLQALHRRCEIGRSLLSRERALLGLANSGVDA
jgi:hypothetical protein